MLKVKQILGSSTSSACGCFCAPHRLKKACLEFPLFSRKPAATLSKSSATASQCGRGFFFNALQMSHIHSGSTPDGGSHSSPSASSAIKASGFPRKIKFCQSCGSPTKYTIPDGGDKMRAICTRCGVTTYENPKMIVGCVVEHENKILLCKRNIEPSRGLWTLPGGFMEIGESASEGAIRETWEEANAEVEVKSPFAVLDLPHIGHTYLMFLAKLKGPHFSPGPESLECQLFALEDIPFESLAFSSMLITLQLYLEDRKMGDPKFHYGVINKRPGSGPSDIHEQTFDHHMKC